MSSPLCRQRKLFWEQAAIKNRNDSRLGQYQPGSYMVFSPAKSIALSLLEGVSLPDLIDVAALAIAGTVTTENLGVEHLVKNLIANPHIRHLVLFGTEIQGHFPGDALLKLHENGTDLKGRIIAAQGARPILKNLTQLEIGHFRSQVQIRNLIGNTDLPLLVAQVAALGKLDLGPYDVGLRVDLVEATRAEPARRLKLKKAGYFVIMVMGGRPNRLVVEHYSNDGVLRNLIEGTEKATAQLSGGFFVIQSGQSHFGLELGTVLFALFAHL